MRRRVRSLCLIGAMALGFQLLMAGPVFAHAITVTAAAVCENSTPTINFTVVSWSTDPNDGSHPKVNIRFGGAAGPIETFGALPPLPGEFAGSLAAPAGPTVIVYAEVDPALPWGDGQIFPASHSVLVTIPQDCVQGVGRFTGGGNQVDVGVGKITRGLTIHCDLLLSNNLEINWGGGNNFHMTEHTSAQCSDDPEIEQKPPVAPLDTLIGVGTGRFNNVPGYTVEFTLVDAGEPGRNDLMAIRIFNTTTLVEVLNIPLQNLTGGNLQAHYDQPHGNKPQ